MKAIAVRVDGKGRVLLPRKLRQTLRVGPGDIFFVQPGEDDSLRLVRAPNPFDVLAEHAIVESQRGHTISLDAAFNDRDAHPR